VSRILTVRAGEHKAARRHMRHIWRMHCAFPEGDWGLEPIRFLSYSPYYGKDHTPLPGRFGIIAAVMAAMHIGGSFQVPGLTRKERRSQHG